MTTDESGMDPRWRDRIDAIGSANFELEEMLRLGFLTADQVDHSAEQLARYEATLDELAEAVAELASVREELKGSASIATALRAIRARRIERVRATAQYKRTEKARLDAQRHSEWVERKTVTPVFLGRGVSSRLSFEGGDTSRQAALGLPALTTFVDISERLDLTPSRLQWLAYERAAASSDHYSRFEIPKRSGGTRLISSPKPALRMAQQWVRESVLSHLSPHGAAMAFRPRTSIVDNARIHAGESVVVRMDLKEFFPSLTYVRVRGFFESLGYNPGVASVLALLTTDAPRARVTLDGVTTVVAVGERSLPQGACTSPDLANLIARGLDQRLTGLAGSRGWAYTRYADDLVFSTSVASEDAGRLVRGVTGICASEGYVVNTKKTRIMRQPNRQTVTGLLVNDGVRLTRRDLRRIRAFLHRCETQGLEAVSEDIGKSAAHVARGYHAYATMVMPSAAARMRANHPWI